MTNHACRWERNEPLFRPMVRTRKNEAGTTTKPERHERIRIMPENFWKIQREISELLAKSVLSERDLEHIERLRDAMANFAA